MSTRIPITVEVDPAVTVLQLEVMAAIVAGKHPTLTALAADLDVSRAFASHVFLMMRRAVTVRVVKLEERRR